MYKYKYLHIYISICIYMCVCICLYLGGRDPRTVRPRAAEAVSFGLAAALNVYASISTEGQPGSCFRVNPI